VLLCFTCTSYKVWKTDHTTKVLRRILPKEYCSTTIKSLIILLTKYHGSWCILKYSRRKDLL